MSPRPRRHDSSLYPLHPDGSRWLSRVSESEYTLVDKLVVGTSSLVIVGSVAWAPCLLAWAYRRWKRVQDRRKKTIYAALIAATVGLYAVWAPHRNAKLGDWLRVREWKLWKAWIRFLAVEVVLDQPKNDNLGKNERMDLKENNAILAFVPHGIFPFSFGAIALVEEGRKLFGSFRPIVASAVKHVPILADLVCWIGGLDASRSTVRRALSQGHRVGLVPGGIDEMFTGYPRPGCHPDEEYAIVRKGFLRMALQYKRPVIPVYCFGSTKLFRRLQLPNIVETLSHILRMSLVVFYGVWGLPIPFRQRLTYIVGDPILPNDPSLIGLPENEQVNALHKQFCQELERLFERHKEAYGWGHKTLQLLSK